MEPRGKDDLMTRNELLTKLMCDNQSIQEHVASQNEDVRTALLAIQTSFADPHRVLACTVDDILAGFSDTYMRNVLLDQICSYDPRTQIVLAAYANDDFLSHICTATHTKRM